MRKLPLMFAVLVSMSFTPGVPMAEGDDIAQPEITIDPLPPTQGKPATISYNGTLPVQLKLRWVPAGAGPDSIEIGMGGSAVLTMPSNAASLTITDPSRNGADAESTAVTP